MLKERKEDKVHFILNLFDKIVEQRRANIVDRELNANIIRGVNGLLIDPNITVIMKGRLENFHEDYKEGQVIPELDKEFLGSIVNYLLIKDSEYTENLLATVLTF